MLLYQVSNFAKELESKAVLLKLCQKARFVIFKEVGYHAVLLESFCFVVIYCTMIPVFHLQSI